MTTPQSQFFYILFLIVTFLMAVTKYLTKNNLREYWVKCFGSQFERIQSLMVEEAWFIVAGACGWDCLYLGRLVTREREYQPCL